jgi:hypothetical protein
LRRSVNQIPVNQIMENRKDSSPDWLTLSAKQETDPARKESGETAKVRHSLSVCRGKSNFKPKQGGKLKQVLP